MSWVEKAGKRTEQIILGSSSAQAVSIELRQTVFASPYLHPTAVILHAGIYTYYYKSIDDRPSNNGAPGYTLKAEKSTYSF